jgi:hypothetical protein
MQGKEVQRTCVPSGSVVGDAAKPNARFFLNNFRSSIRRCLRNTIKVNKHGSTKSTNEQCGKPGHRSHFSDPEKQSTFSAQGTQPNENRVGSPRWAAWRAPRRAFSEVFPKMKHIKQ